MECSTWEIIVTTVATVVMIVLYLVRKYVNSECRVEVQEGKTPTRPNGIVLRSGRQLSSSE